MQLHEIKSARKQGKKRIGRGGKKGTYSGRGMKGQKSRAGRRFPPAFRGVLQKYPKLKGWKFNKQEKGLVAVNVDVIQKKFNAGETVSPKILLEKKIVRGIKGKMPKIKILGRGEIIKAVVVTDCLLSAKAKEKLVKAGASIVS